MVFPILQFVAVSALLQMPSAAPDTADAASEQFAVHVVIVGPGDQLFSRWGHIALRVDDRSTGYQKVYNYGTFNFRGREDLLRYGRGFLTFRLSTAHWRLTQWAYAVQNRDVWLYTLDLSPLQAREIVRRLRENARPENRDYAYRHYLDNCSTRIRDLLDDVLGGAVGSGRRNTPTGHTFRYWTREYLIGSPVMRSLILFVLGPAIDHPITRWDEQFLPDLLAQDLVASGLVSSIRHVGRRHGPAARNMVPLLDSVVIGLVLLLALLGFGLPLLLWQRPMGNRLHGLGLALWGLVGGGGGTVLALFWGVTEHTDTWYNENILLFPLTHLWLVPLGLYLMWRPKGGERTRRFALWYLGASLALVGVDVLLKLGPCVQDNWAYLTVAGLINLLLLLRHESV